MWGASVIGLDVSAAEWNDDLWKEASHKSMNTKTNALTQGTSAPKSDRPTDTPRRLVIKAP